MGQGYGETTTSNTSRHLVAALLLTTAISSVPVLIAQPAFAQLTAQTSFSIPAGPLNQALATFARQAGLQITYNPTIAANRQSSGVSGQQAPQQAIAQILQGTGLVYSFPNARTVAISEPSSAGTAGGVAADGSTVLDTITIQGANPNSTFDVPEAYAGGQVARGGQVGMLGNRDVMNTPFSQTSYTKKTIEDQQARSVHDVLANDPSVVTNRAASRHDTETIRGLEHDGISAARSVNGLPGIAPMEFPSADYLERVEVLKGPSALLVGMAGSGYGNIGGAVNLVTKRAADEPLTEITTRYSSRSRLGAHVDVGRRFGPNKEFGIRFNGAFDKGDTDVDNQRSQLGLAALNLDYRGERVRLSLDFVHESQDLDPYANYVSIRNVAGIFTSIPAAPDGSTSLFPSWAKRETTTTFGMIRGELDILENVTAYAAIGGQNFDKDSNLTVPAELTGADGSYTLLPWWNPVSYETRVFQGGVRATAATGQIDHAFNLQASHSKYTFRQSNWIGTSFSAGTIYDPVFPSMPNLTDPGDPLWSSETKTTSFGISDTMSIFDERIQFTAGLRYQKVDSSSLYSNYESDAWSPAFGLVVKPWENISLYANYIEGLQTGTTVGSYYANAGDVFAPYVSKQYEAGIKADWGNVTTTLAVFQISQPSTITIPDLNGGSPTLALNGEQRNRGIELSAYGEIYDGVRLLGGVTFLEAIQTKTLNGALDGERAHGAPRVRAVIGGEWDTPFVEGLTLNGRLTYTGDQVAYNSAPDLKIPSWTHVDVGARYTFNSPWNEQPITVRFNVDNVFNKNYWATASYGFVYPGQPRTYRLSTTFKF